MWVRGVGVLLVVSAAVAPAIARAQSGVFKTGSSAFTDGRPGGIAVGTFDEDPSRCENVEDAERCLDAVVSNTDAGTVSMLLGFNDGTLSNTGSFPAGNLPSAVVAADFDGDGHLDLLVANENDARVVFLKGGGDGTFAPPGDPVPVGDGPKAIAVGNFDGDTNLDAAVACEGESDSSIGSVHILRGHGDGTFSRECPSSMGCAEPPEPDEAFLTTELGTRAVAIGRIDADQLLDIVVANSISDSVSVFFGTGGFTFTPGSVVRTGSAPKGVAVGRLDGDATLDVVTADFNGDTVSVLLSNGDRTFRPRAAFAVGTGPNAVLVGQLNDDGSADVLVSNERSGDVSVLLGDGSGTLGVARHFVSDVEPLALALENFDADGRLDVVTANSDAAVWVLRNDGNGRLAAAEDLPAASIPAMVAAGDLDDDGYPDLVVTRSSGEVSVFRSLRDAGFSSAQTLVTVPGEARDVAVADLNRDGVLDLAIVDDRPGVDDDVVVAVGRGDGTFAPPAAFPVADESAAITTGDFNADRIVDLAVAGGGSTGVTSVLIGRGNGTFDEFKTQPVDDTPVAIAAADLNCDGRDDLLVGNFASDTVSVLVSDGDGTFTEGSALTNAGARPTTIAVVDLNRDGQPDIVVGNGIATPGEGNLHAFLGQPDPCDATFTRLNPINAGDLVVDLIPRDLVRAASDPAGALFADLAVVNQSSNAVRVFRGNGQGGFRNLGLDNVSRMPVAVAAADFDGDGRYDVATANGTESSKNVSVLTNAAAPAVLRGDGNGDARVSAADMVALVREVPDGDGNQVEDIVRLGFPGKAGVDANGDGRVDAQDGKATARRIFEG